MAAASLAPHFHTSTRRLLSSHPTLRIPSIPRHVRRHISTLPAPNSHIYISPHPTQPKTFTLSLLPSSSPILSLATSTSNPPTPSSVTSNPRFLSLLNSTLSKHASQDPYIKGQAVALASSGGSTLSSTGTTPTHSSHARRSSRTAVGDGAGGASSQGGAGGAGVGGYIHVSDSRNPPDYGRIAWPEDIMGSLEVDGMGNFVDGHGNFQESGTYRLVTKEGICGLSPFMYERVVEALKEVQGKVEKGVIEDVN